MLRCLYYMIPFLMQTDMYQRSFVTCYKSDN
jgi:hypothetical protein